jgi:hypothetical protein
MSLEEKDRDELVEMIENHVVFFEPQREIIFRTAERNYSFTP